MDEAGEEPSCQPQTCREGEVRHSGQCHVVGERGPCQEFEVLSLNEVSLEPECSPDPTRVRRIVEAIPRIRGLVRFGPVGSRFKVRVPRCNLNRFGRCKQRKRINSVNHRVPLYKSAPQKYLNWLNKYRK